MTTPQEPRTEAGRALLALYAPDSHIGEHILAIEAQAATPVEPDTKSDAVAALAKKLSRVHVEKTVWPAIRNDPNAQADGYVHYCANLCEGGRSWPCLTAQLLEVLSRPKPSEDSGEVERLWAALETTSGAYHALRSTMVANPHEGKTFLGCTADICVGARALLDKAAE